MSNSSKENEPKGKGFCVRVEGADLILQAAQRGFSGDLGKILLSEPLESVSVELKSQKDTFNLVGEIAVSFNARYANHNPLKVDKLRLAIATKYGDFRERGGNYIVRSPGGTQIVVGHGPAGLDRIEVSTGYVSDIIESVQIVPPPKATTEDFETAMDDFVNVLETSVSEAYRMAMQPEPGEELILRPPTRKLGDQKGGASGFGEMTTPEQIRGKIEVERPNVSFEDIGGQEKAKREIEGLAFALKNPELYRKWGTRPPKGVILYGPPGTGKTLMAKALASQADANFFRVESSDIASKWYGESEKIVKSIFEFANSNTGKTIIFFDEIDAIAPRREGAHEATQRVVGTLLENLDGLSSNDNVMVVASTNRLDGIEPALLRAGRIDRWVEVALPDESGRKQIFDIHIAKAEKAAGRKLFGDINIDTIVAKTDKTSGADLAEIVRRVLEEKVRQEGTRETEPLLVTTEELLRELEGYERIKIVKKTIGFSAPNGK